MQNMKIYKTRTLLILLSVIFLLTLIPLFYIGIYAHPSADDYSYGISTSNVWQKTHSMRAVLHTAAEKTIDKYYNWQGNFSAIFLMYLQPGILGENYYMLAPFFLLTAFLVFSLFFYYTVFHKTVKSTPSLSMICALLITGFALQFTHVPSDSFYWYNGAVYYTFFYSLSLLLYGCLINLYYSQRLIKRLLLPSCMLLSFIIGGSNYATALLNAILLFFTCIYMLFRKNHHLKYYLPVFIAGLTSLLISMSGPGNMVRQGTIGDPHSALGAILLSFVYGAYSFANATTVPLFLFWLLLIPIFWKMINNVDFSFNHPLYVLILSFCIYSAQITPVIYAQGIRIPYRIRNIVYFNYFVFTAFNLFYFLGYLKSRRIVILKERPFSLRAYYTGLLIAILISCFGSVIVTEKTTGEIELSNLPFSASAIYSLVTGEAQRYDEQANERTAILENSGHIDVVFRPFDDKPFVLFHSDISTDVKYWKNLHMAQYYGKRTVRLTK